MRSIPGCTEPKTYGEARSQLADALKMLAEANSLLLWWRYGKSMTLKQCAHLNDKTDIALGRFGLSEADIDRPLSASAEPSAPVERIAAIRSEAAELSSKLKHACCQSCMANPCDCAIQSARVEFDHDALVAAVCVLRSQGLSNLSAAVEEARAALERKP